MSLKKMTIALQNGKITDHGPAYVPEVVPSLMRYAYNPQQPRDRAGRWATLANHHLEKAASNAKGPELQRHLATAHAANAARTIASGQDGGEHLSKLHAAVTALRIQAHNAKQAGKDHTEREAAHKHYNEMYKQLMKARKGKADIPDVKHFGPNTLPETPEKPAEAPEAPEAPKPQAAEKTGPLTAEAASKLHKHLMDVHHLHIKKGNKHQIEATHHLMNAAASIGKSNVMMVGHLRAAREAFEKAGGESNNPVLHKHLKRLESHAGDELNHHSQKYEHAKLAAKARAVPVSTLSPYVTQKETESREHIARAHELLAEGHDHAEKGDFQAAEGAAKEAAEHTSKIDVVPNAQLGHHAQALQGVNALKNQAALLQSAQKAATEKQAVKDSNASKAAPSVKPPAPEKFSAPHPGTVNPITSQEAHEHHTRLNAHIGGQQLSEKARKVTEQAVKAAQAAETANGFKDTTSARAARHMMLAHTLLGAAALNKTPVTSKADKAAFADARHTLTRLKGTHPESLTETPQMGNLTEAMTIKTQSPEEQKSKNSLIQGLAHLSAATEALDINDKAAVLEHHKRAAAALKNVSDAHQEQRDSALESLNELSNHLTGSTDKQEHTDQYQDSVNVLNEHPKNPTSHAISTARMVLAHAANLAHHKLTGQGNPQEIKASLMQHGHHLLKLADAKLDSHLRAGSERAVAYLNKHLGTKFRIPKSLPGLNVDHHEEALDQLNTEKKGMNGNPDQIHLHHAHGVLRSALTSAKHGDHKDALKYLGQAEHLMGQADPDHFDAEDHHHHSMLDLHTRMLHDELVKHAASGSTPEHHELAASIAHYHGLQRSANIHEALAAGNHAKARQLMETQDLNHQAMQKKLGVISNGMGTSPLHAYNNLRDSAKRALALHDTNPA